MAFIVEMFNYTTGFKSKKGEPDPGYREFSCSSHNWENTLKLGRKMGWLATGSVLEKTIDTPNPVISDYEPSSWGDDDYKVFLAKDAAALADALEKAVTVMKLGKIKSGKHGPALIVSGMNEKEYKNINRDISTDFLSDFIVFLRKGKFKFVWDD
jgi:hypothetical protein